MVLFRIYFLRFQLNVTMKRNSLYEIDIWILKRKLWEGRVFSVCGVRKSQTIHDLRMPFARLSKPERKLAYALLKYRVITRKRAQQVPSCLHWESFIILSRTSAPRFHGISFRPVFPNLFFFFFFFSIVPSSPSVIFTLYGHLAIFFGRLLVISDEAWQRMRQRNFLFPYIFHKWIEI